MAWDPCVSCGKPFHGSTSFTYVTWHQGETRLAFRLRQCLECAAELRNSTSAAGDKRNAEGGWDKVEDQVPDAFRGALP
jgi:hypothetical protein